MYKQYKQLLLAFSMVAFGFASHAQTSGSAIPQGWHLKDFKEDSLYGISLDKAYDFVKGKKSRTVIVAVIDSGIDTTHEDLKPVLWRNTKEIEGNGIDDDRNGYVDDINGWNFIGGKDGRNVNDDSYETSRVYHKFKARYDGVTNPSNLNQEEQENFRIWKKAEKLITVGRKDSIFQAMWFDLSFKEAAKSDSVLRSAMGKDSYTGKELDALVPASDQVKEAKGTFLRYFKPEYASKKTNKAFLEEFGEYWVNERKKDKAEEIARLTYRAEIVKDNYQDISDRFYGNSDIMAATSFHGTHVAGIIGAVRGNGKGIDGVADNVRIMAIRAVPDGDEHDKDVALAIRYAVDNGAMVINMSFGKSLSPEKMWVDDAVKYAEAKGVLLVHAAGNDAVNIDSVEVFPHPIFKANGRKATNWISVGASRPKLDGIVAYFTNYGKSEVDVLAPGVKIYSTIPGGNTYGDAQGTSMASPVVAGVAAFILQYYPALTPQQVKQVIERSTTKILTKVNRPRFGDKMDPSEICKTGGVVNAFEAIRLADQITSKGTRTKAGLKYVRKNNGKNSHKTF